MFNTWDLINSLNILFNFLCYTSLSVEIYKREVKEKKIKSQPFEKWEYKKINNILELLILFLKYYLWV